jgi:hypothetical protein
MLMKTEGDYSYLGQPTTAMKLRKWALAATYGVLLIVLFVLYATVDSGDSSSSQSGAIGSFPSAAPLAASQVGLAASLGEGGALQLGGGTSVYQGLYQLPGVCAKTPGMEPLFDSSYIMTFVDGVKGAWRCLSVVLSFTHSLLTRLCIH